MSTEQPIINVENGSLKGSVKHDYEGKNYYSFQGIPYAKPPVGELRFKAPRPSEPWSGIRDATKEGNRCYSQNPLLKTYGGSEDCLFLNVYTPELPSAEKSLKPVMFWIHGGGFAFGSGNAEFYGPDYLIPENVVIVTINYRLGLLGFLSFEDESLDISGNAGLKDQVMALRWVNKNIIRFGGDPNNVTIFGESAGGVSVHCLILSPLAKGLFHKAIIQSGTTTCALMHWQKCIHPLAVGMGMENSTESELYKILKTMPVAELLQLQEKISTQELSPSTPLLIGPIIESETATVPFLTKTSVESLRSGKFNHVPIMIGYTSREGLYLEMNNSELSSEDKPKMTIENAIPYDLNIPKDSDLYKIVRDKIKTFYFGTEEPSAQNTDQYYLLQGDIGFVHSAYSTIKLHKLTSDQPIYFYRMSVKSKLNHVLKASDLGVCHADDVRYLFKNILPVSLLPNSVEVKAIKIFTKLWTEFAKTGNPNPVAEDDNINVTWKPVEKEKFHFLDIGENVTVGVNPDYNRVLFWDSIYELRSPYCEI